MWQHGLHNALPPRTEGEDTAPAVTVVIRTKNRPLLFRRACQSVLEQRFSDWTLAIVNDGGDRAEVENVVKTLSAPAGRLTVLHNDVSLGMEAASNLGVRSARSRYVAIHDDDDTWHPDFLAECVGFLDGNATGMLCAGVATQTLIIREEMTAHGVVQIGTELFQPTQTNISLFRMAGANAITNNSFVFRRSVFDALGGFNEQLPVLGDWEFNIRLLSRWEIGFIRKQLANYHFRVNLQDTAYGNTIIGGIATHYDLDGFLRNQLLRNTMADDPHLLGLVINMSQAFERLNRKLDDQAAVLKRLETLVDRLGFLSSSIGKLIRPASVGWRTLKPIGSRIRAALSQRLRF